MVWTTETTTLTYLWRTGTGGWITFKGKTSSTGKFNVKWSQEFWLLKGVDDEPTCFRLDQGLLRREQTPFSSFLVWLSTGDCLLPGRETGGGGRGRAIRAFVTVCYSVLGFLYEKSCLSWLAGQWGRLQSLDPPWSYTDARVCKGAKIGLVWGI